MKIISKLPNVGLTIFSEMTKLANELNAINLSQGFPDFEPQTELKELVTKYMMDGFNQYAPMQGVLLLRERIAEKVIDLYGVEYGPETEITITSGATEAVFAAITAVVGPGDEVIVFEPCYDAYVPAIELCGGVPVYCSLKFPEYSIDWDVVENNISPRTKLIILNSPHNPSGSVMLEKDFKHLTRIVNNSEIFVLSDEVYEHIIFDGQQHESICKFPELRERGFVINSFGKTYHTTGWKIGYCLAPQMLSTEFRKIHQYLTFASNTPVQYAYAEFLRRKEIYLDLPDFYQKKRDIFLRLVKKSRFKALPCKGTYFQMLDYSGISREPDMEFAKRLTSNPGIAAIPPSVFYHNREDNKVLRFCFAKKDETLQEAAELLCQI